MRSPAPRALLTTAAVAVSLAALYVFLSATLVWLLKRIASGAPPEEELEEDQEKQSEGAYAI